MTQPPWGAWGRVPRMPSGDTQHVSMLVAGVGTGWHLGVRAPRRSQAFPQLCDFFSNNITTCQRCS